MKVNDIERVFIKCQKIRGLPNQLRHRVFLDFGYFIREMVDFLIFGITSVDKDIKRFQSRIIKDVLKGKYNPEEFETYVKLFYEFYKMMLKEEGWDE
jgi:hypothetical protein